MPASEARYTSPACVVVVGPERSIVPALIVIVPLPRTEPPAPPLTYRLPAWTVVPPLPTAPNVLLLAVKVNVWPGPFSMRPLPAAPVMLPPKLAEASMSCTPAPPLPRSTLPAPASAASDCELAKVVVPCDTRVAAEFRPVLTIRFALDATLTIDEARVETLSVPELMVVEPM